MPQLMITWHTAGDDRVCPVCRALNNYTWTFVVGADEFPSFLSSPEGNLVWDVATGSTAHGHKGNCRCRLTVAFDLEDLRQSVEKLLEGMEVAAK